VWGKGRETEDRGKPCYMATSCLSKRQSPHSKSQLPNVPPNTCHQTCHCRGWNPIAHGIVLAWHAQGPGFQQKEKDRKQAWLKHQRCLHGQKRQLARTLSWIRKEDQPVFTLLCYRYEGISWHRTRFPQGHGKRNRLLVKVNTNPSTKSSDLTGPQLKTNYH
jgi:hypothetical protein